MTVLEFIDLKRLKKIQLASSIGIDASRLSKYLHSWQPLPKRYVALLARELGVSREEIEANTVNDWRVTDRQLP